jgi:hypothetical protein
MFDTCPKARPKDAYVAIIPAPPSRIIAALGKRKLAQEPSA